MPSPCFSAPLQEIEITTSADFPTRYGQFRLYGFMDRRNNKEHTAVVMGEVAGREDCPVRAHSECHTGDVWGSLRCDCREQLEQSLAYIGQQRCGAVLYLRQEGRGIGLLNKIKAYHLQDQGYNTIEANLQLGFPADAREYWVAARMIELLQIKSVALLTNNPDKLSKLKAEGTTITRRIPVEPTPNQHNRHYLDVKKDEMGHLY